MKEPRTRLVIRGNELYEIDLDCMKKKQEGKTCWEEKHKSTGEAEKNKRDS